MRARLPNLIEAAGAACLVVAGAIVHPALAWAVGGVCLLAKSFEQSLRSDN